MSTPRTRRVAELIREEVSRILRDEVKDPRVHDVVITDVTVTKDMSLARIFFSSYDSRHMGDIKQGLEKSSGFIRHVLMKVLEMKKVPRLEFVVDETPESATRIDDLLRQIGGDHERDH